MLNTITLFNQVELINSLKYLIICDIDDTILYFPECNKVCKEIIKNLNLTDKDYEKDFEHLKILYKRINTPIHTDYDGFISILTKINKSNSKLIYLTARNFTSDILTKKHLKQIGVSPDNFDIHYTNSQISKGEYIKRYIDLSIWENIIFIDDNDTNIKSVKDIHPQIVCYKFNINS
jgi:hypothetical protein